EEGDLNRFGRARDVKDLAPDAVLAYDERVGPKSFHGIASVVHHADVHRTLAHVGLGPQRDDRWRYCREHSRCHERARYSGHMDSKDRRPAVLSIGSAPNDVKPVVSLKHAENMELIAPACGTAGHPARLTPQGSHVINTR